ncbi:LysR family transcriptional regulator [Nesterenkonia flava]|uniref:LysR family transcriptional regulator n=1 Tax=Nesterenkonia flava TaxID=469799 RepID=A0ABU1FPP0_9MICC|nr:LysR family transcriptional regulator [Nesterenkonia flava]MDR5710607.1 LysR family transcriptional regulator [Nesterenkonia flava]
MDLNLLRVFAAVYEEGSLSGAAGRLHLTQPTISHSCQKLRRHYGDPLFVRTGRGVRPTSFADDLYRQVGAHVQALDGIAAQRVSFDPAIARQEFVLCLSDIGESAFLPTILSRLMVEAPGVTVQSVPVDVATAAERLSRGECDVVITSGHLEATTESWVIRRDSYCFVHHPAATVPLKDGRYAEVPFVFGHPSLGHHPPVQRLLESEGFSGVRYSTVQSFSSLPYILTTLPGASVAPELIVRHWRHLWPQLRLTPLPTGEGIPEVRLHRRPGAVTPALDWFCAFVLDAARSATASLPK